MTFTLDPIYIYLTVNVILAALLLYNIRKVDKIKDEVNSMWQQIAMMAIASGSTFIKIEKKLDEKQDRESGTGGHSS